MTSLPTWSVKTKAASRVRTYNDGALRRLIRKCTLSGLELVKYPLGDEWVPLHTVPLFREEATGGATALDTKALARNREMAMRRFIVLMIGSGVTGIATGIAAATGAQGAVVGFSMASMAFLAGGWITGMIMAVKYGGNSRGKPSVATTTTPVLDELARAIASLERSVAAAPQSVRDLIALPALRDGAAAMRRKRALLRSLQSPEDPRPGLLAELATARECAAKATDASSADAFADEIRSIKGLLESLDRALESAAEAESRERAMVNELEALSHAVVAATVAGSGEDALVDRLASLRRTLEEESAIEQDLSRGVRRMGPLQS